MNGAAVTFQKTVLSLSVVKRTTKEAWSAYCRRRWPTNCQAHCEREWDLTPGRANGLVWSNTTQTTIDMIAAHPRGGTLVLLEVEAIRAGLTLHELLAGAVAALRERAANERAKADAEDRALVALADRLSAARPGLPAVQPVVGLQTARQGLSDRRGMADRRSFQPDGGE